MKKFIGILIMSMAMLSVLGQAGHIMQGIGARNMSMGGAATGQPLDISGTLQWNPAGISTFQTKMFSANAGLFFSSPELSSTVITNDGSYQGVTKDDRGVSVMPSLAMVWGKKDSRHTFGVSAFGISGFGVTFPENMMNPINLPQEYGGFGKIQSDYQLLQVGVTYAYKITDQFSVGLAPTFNFATLQLEPNPIASPGETLGYPKSNKASALGIGGQIGVFYQGDKGFKAGASYKTPQYFGDFTFKNTYLNGDVAPDASFKMNYPGILSVGTGYSNKTFDFALDYRFVNYKNTEGFEAKGWTNTGSVKGFGWENISIVSAGIQYKGIAQLPIRVGYTYSSNPITSELAFFSTPATAIIKNGVQVGFGFNLNKKVSLDFAYHHGSSGGSTSGPLLSPMMVSSENPYGKIPGTNVSYKMTTDLVMVGVNIEL